MVYLSFTHLFLQSVTPHLSLGGEVFWAGQHRKSGIGYAARFNTDKMVWHFGSCPFLVNQIKVFSLLTEFCYQHFALWNTTEHIWISVISVSNHYITILLSHVHLWMCYAITIMVHGDSLLALWL